MILWADEAPFGGSSAPHDVEWNCGQLGLHCDGMFMMASQVFDILVGMVGKLGASRSLRH